MEMKPTKILLERTMSAPASVPPQVEKRYIEGNDDDDEMEDNEMDNSLKTKLEELNQVANILTQDDGEEEEDDEGGAHDTITSLAGVKMMQKYQRQIRGHGLMRRGSQGSKTQLEQLFKEEPLLEEEEKLAPSEDEEMEEEETEGEDVFVPPDGGYGWWITFGAFLSLFWTAGLVKSYGVIFAEMVRLYPNNIKLASWIPAAMTTTALAMAPIASALCQRLNCRFVTTAGALLAATGLVLSALAPNLILMFLTLGILTGAGIGLSTTPGIILTARYFDKKRSRANALCLSGTAAGSFTLPILIQYLFSIYGLEGTLLLLGGCMLHVLVSASLYRPLADHVIIVRIQARKAANKPPPPAKTVYTQPQHQPIIRSDSLNRSKASALNYKNYSSASIKDTDTQSEYEPLNQISSSCPQTGFLDSVRLSQNLEDYEHVLSKGRPMDQSLDSISMISSVSNRSGGSDVERCIHSCKDHAETSQTHKHVISNNNSRSESRNSNAKSVSLRELALHQIGSQFNLYKTMFFGSPAAAAAATPSSTAPLAASGGGSRVIIQKQKSDDPLMGRKKSSFMFSCEDIMVDSTSILKDSRHPSHTHLSSIPGLRQTHRVVTLNRTQSAAGDVVSCRRSNTINRPTRQRYYSESEKDPYFEMSKNNSVCNLSKSSSNKVSLIGSSELVAEADNNNKNNLLKDGEEECEENVEGAQSQNKSSSVLCNCCAKYLDLSLCKNPVFVIIALSVMLMAIGMPHVLFFMPSYAISVGLTSADASLLLSLSAVCDLCGRLSFGVLIDLNLLPTYVWYVSMILLSGIMALLIPTATTFNQILVYLALFGVGTGGWFLMVPLLLAEYLGVEKIGSSYGLVRLFQAVTNLCGPIIAGYLYGTLGKLEYSFFFMGSSMMVSAAVSFFLPLALKAKEAKSK